MVYQIRKGLWKQGKKNEEVSHDDEKEMTTRIAELKTISLYIAQDLAFWQLRESVQGVGKPE